MNRNVTNVKKQYITCALNLSKINDKAIINFITVVTGIKLH